MWLFQEQAERCKYPDVPASQQHPRHSAQVPCAEGRGFVSAAGSGHILRVSPVPPTAARAESAALGKAMEAIPARSTRRGVYTSGF